jgi:BASS family bile acid:Na+ symporter
MRSLIVIAMPATAFILLVAVGLDLTVSDFTRVRRQLTLVLTGLLAPLVLLPPLALLLVSLFDASRELAAGILLVAACPIGGISNTYSYLARASPALSVTLTGLSCLCASVTIPLVGKALELASGTPLEIEAPLSLLASQLLVVLSLPIAVGMWARSRSPDLARRCGPILQRVAFVGVAIILALIVAGDRGTFRRELATTAPLAAAFVTTSTIVGWVVAALITRDPRDRFTIAAEFGTRNIGIATAIAVTLLGRLEFGRFVAVYAMVEVPFLLGAVAAFRYWQRKTDVGGLEGHPAVS